MASSFFHVKWIPKLSLSNAPLSQRWSAANVRSSVIHKSGVISEPNLEIASIAATASLRSTKNSVWISSPTLGVNSSLKWGKRSCQFPGTPNCSVHATGSTDEIGWTFLFAFALPPIVSGIASPSRNLHQRFPTPVLPPIGEVADAVCASHDLIEVVLQNIERYFRINDLPNFKGRFNPELILIDNSS